MPKAKISGMEWPGNSPDFNPIENLWQILKVVVRKKRPKTLDTLDQIIKETWYSGLKEEILKKLIDSMPERIKAVIKSREGGTNKILNKFFLGQ